MARSLWKGNAISKCFINSAFAQSLQSATQIRSKGQKFLISRRPSSSPSFSPQFNYESLELMRRNHVITPTQSLFLAQSNADNCFYVYNGYDKLPVKPLLSQPAGLYLNVASLVPTREVNVSHKVKLSKAARKNKAKLVKKKTAIVGGKHNKKPALMKNHLTKKILK